VPARKRFAPTIESPQPAQATLLRHLCTSIVLTVAGLAHASPAWAESLDVQWDDEQLSVYATDASAFSLVQELAEQTGVRFIATGNTATNVTMEIVAEPLERAIAKLAPNHLLVHSKSDPTTVVEVVLMFDEGNSGNSGSGGEFLPTGSPAEEVMPLPDQAQELLQETPLQQVSDDNPQAGIINRLKGVARSLEQPKGVLIEGAANDLEPAVDPQQLDQALPQ